MSNKFSPKRKDYLTFHEWEERNKDLLSMTQKCPECFGSGEAECPCCGSLVECDACKGSGKVILLENGDKVSLQTLYYLHRRRDIAATKSFFEGNNSSVPPCVPKIVTTSETVPLMNRNAYYKKSLI